MKFSIIIPVYNAAEYLRECLDSLLQDEREGVEVIAIDDGSTDQSPAILDEYASRYANVRVTHKANEGVSVARNLGIEQATGDYIIFVDADDWVTRDYFSVLWGSCERADLTFFPMTYCYEDGSRATFQFGHGVWTRREDMEAVVRYLIHNDAHHNFYGFTWDKAFRREVIEAHHIRFQQGLFVSEDEIFTNDYLAVAQSMQVVPQAIYNYRWKPVGLTHAKKPLAQFTALADAELRFGESAASDEMRKFVKGRAVEFALGSVMHSSGALNVVKRLWTSYRYAKRHSAWFPWTQAALNVLRWVKRK